MYAQRTFLAIIPARGGSKRLPRKNIKLLGNKPLIAWTIDAAKKSKYIDEIMVSTDDKEIESISKQFGAKIPFLRPDHLATDTATTVDVVLDVIKFYEDELHMNFTHVILLQPTSPFRNSDHIDEAIEYLNKVDADAVVSVSQAEHSPLWMNKLPKDDNMSMFLRKGLQNIRSQDLDTYYRLNGALYICDIEKLREKGSFFIDTNIYAYKMEQKKSIDIDTKFDFEFAEFLIERDDYTMNNQLG